MEANRDEAERCVELAVAALREGRRDRAERLLRTSLRLYPLPRAAQLLETVTAATTTTTSSSSSSSSSSKSSQSPPNNTADDVSDEVRRVLAAADGDHYGILGLPRGADIGDVKRAYKRLALRVHPDRCRAPGAEDAFKRLGRAYSVLGDPSAKRTYDVHGVDPSAAASARPRASATAENVFRRRTGFVFENAEGIDPDELFRQFFFFPGAAVFQAQQQQQQQRWRQQQYRFNRNQFAADPAGCLRLMVLVGVFIAISVLSSMLSAPGQQISQHFEPSYQLRKSGEYVVEHTSGALGLKFFVKQSTPKNKLSEIEREVDIHRIQHLARECEIANSRKWRGLPYNPDVCTQAQQARVRWQRAAAA